METRRSCQETCVWGFPTVSFGMLRGFVWLRLFRLISEDYAMILAADVARAMDPSRFEYGSCV